MLGLAVSTTGGGRVPVVVFSGVVSYFVDAFSP